MRMASVGVTLLVGIGLVMLAAACQEAEEEARATLTATATATAGTTGSSTPDTASGVLSTCPSFPEGRSDAAIIATGILSRQKQELVLDSEEFAALSGELERILQLIRDAYSDTASIHARDDRYVPGQIILGVESPLKEAIQNAVASQPSTAGLVTGQAAFDALSTQLGGVRGLKTQNLEKHGYLLLCLDELVNVSAASQAYSKLEGVRNASPNDLCGDGPDIDALRDGDTWYVVFRDAWGDCLAGCWGEELLYFTVTGASVVAVEACRAAVDPSFVSLVELVGGSVPAILVGTPEADDDPWGETVGIGLYLEQNPLTGEIAVVSPVLDAPAYRAGIQAGDVILAVDGETKDVAERIGGPACTEVTLKVRHEDGSVEEITILRDLFTLPEPIRLSHLGIELQAATVTGVLVIAYPSVHEPADEAGIRHGDLILAVNGEPTASWTVDEAVNRLDSFEGEHLTLTVRHDDGTTEDITFSPIYEFCAPVLPDAYRGVAFLNGDVAPAGSTIEAVQGGVTWGTTTTGDAGRYELFVPEPMRLSPPCSPDGPLSFRMGDLWSNESVDWSPGSKELNLTFGSPSTPTPTSDDAGQG
jgi:hypothetical protein